MKAKMFFLVAICMMVVSFVSCETDLFTPEPDVHQAPAVQEPVVAEDSDDVELGDPSFASKSGGQPPYSSWIMDVSSLKDIPSQRFDIDLKYKAAYKHLKQPDSRSCSWTSYVLSIGAIINAKWGSYPVTEDKVYAVKKACKSSNKITDLERYAERTHVNYVKVYRPSISQNRTLGIKQMLNHLCVNRAPFMVIHTCHKIDGSLVGHYVVVHAIDWKKGGKGSTIYYTDPSKKARSNYLDNLYAMDLYDFFEGMLILPDDLKNYNVLFLIPNRY